ncbi:MAG TPA: pyridoxamine 5'-phosphate oxidase family protein [Aestuariivirgaceae bacterium]|jgi:putative heme iron utilization protein
MSSGESSLQAPSPEVVGRAVKKLIGASRHGVLATLLPEGGGPYASLVNFAVDENECAPILLLSQLAWHTRNIAADNRGCLLVTEEPGAKDVLAAARVSLLGTLRPTERNGIDAVYFRAHPSARSYGRFSDFRFYEFNVDTAHYVAGFGQIVTLGRAQLINATS